MSENDTFVRGDEVSRITGVKRSTRYELLKKGLFPKPIKLSERMVAWSLNEVQEWQASRIAARDGGQPRPRGRPRNTVSVSTESRVVR